MDRREKNTQIRKRIEALPKTVADKIAAGEVVDRPLSIVKELVENSIDAGASSIIVEIKNGGKTYIRVTDNGCGIEKADTLLAFQRHATSKIRASEDLDHITSLGFRGEALASIAAVSKTELITKPASEKTGISIKVEGGELAEQTETGCPDGTTMIVSDLFYNTPARLKFMKSDGTESTLIIDFISKLALAYPAVKIRLINNGNILFSTPGKNDTYANILTIYSKEIGSHLIPFSEEAETMSLQGFVSGPDYSKTNRKNLIFFVNGRFIASKVMEHGVREGYGETLNGDRHPVAFLFLHILPEKLDVNIHPNKKEVRFDDEKEVGAFISAAIRKHLNTKDGIPSVKAENLFRYKVPESSSKASQGGQGALQAQNLVVGETGPSANQWTVKPHKYEQIDIKKILETKRQNSIDPPISGLKSKTKEAGGKNTNQKIGESMQAPFDLVSTPGAFDFQISDIEPTGSIFGTYITGVDADHFYLIDQHAAHERIFYEQLFNQYQREEKLQQAILVPLVINVSLAVKNAAENCLDFLAGIGYDIEEFGTNSYIVKSIPMFMELAEAKEFLDDFLDNAEQGADFQNQRKLSRIISNSCKKAVKAHDLLDMQEIKQLLFDLAKCQNPYSCPHGRPTFIKMSKYEIEKLFKRV